MHFKTTHWTLAFQAFLIISVLPGDRTAAKAAYVKTEEKTAGVGQKMDLAFSTLRWAGRRPYPLTKYTPLAGNKLSAQDS